MTSPTDEELDALVKRLTWHREHPVTGKLVYANEDGPDAAASITALRAQLAEAEAKALRMAAEKATSFLVGDPLNGTPLRNPMAHEIAAAILNMIPKEGVIAALEAAPHVNETPKSEHDSAGVLTAMPAATIDPAKVHGREMAYQAYINEMTPNGNSRMDNITICAGPNENHQRHIATQVDMAFQAGWFAAIAALKDATK